MFKNYAKPGRAIESTTCSHQHRCAAQDIDRPVASVEPFAPVPHPAADNRYGNIANRRFIGKPD